MTHRHPDPVGDSSGFVTRALLEVRFRDPSCPHGALYLAAMAELSSEPLAGKHVLDYNCASAEFGIWMATEFAEVHLLDPSPANIELGLKCAQTSEVARRVNANQLIDAANLDMFADSAFDLVFARSGLIDREQADPAIREIVRVLKPGSRLVLVHEGPPEDAIFNRIRPLFSDFEVHAVSVRKGWLALRRPPSHHLILARK